MYVTLAPGTVLESQQSQVNSLPPLPENYVDYLTAMQCELTNAKATESEIKFVEGSGVDPQIKKKYADGLLEFVVTSENRVHRLRQMLKTVEIPR